MTLMFIAGMLVGEFIAILTLTLLKFCKEDDEE